ncbi:hypothetical protein H310_10017 [Aphanomyces invadans]|uniref:Uncharacterized protein n=1 Tax=Aphanomyces invadans TaxID=157072 RepID=A0A024TRR3_9STRA|nr:hypothetical protein H310_10017 [Aphanomyces invadans]ETV96699.1 hypothetical protein H310_10017 [Aphanomyces invadans]|eukprot:XP_008874476.1 hypothetical protein H310_10017 [Aphanomyces invadans]
MARDKTRQAEFRRKQYEKNREKELAVVRSYYEQNKAKIAAGKREYYEANKERIMARVKAYRLQNKERKTRAESTTRTAHHKLPVQVELPCAKDTPYRSHALALSFILN